MTKTVLSLAAGALALTVGAGSALAEAGVKAGYLRCDVEEGTSFIFGSTTDIHCTYTPEEGDRTDRYDGEINRYGVDLGFRDSGVMIWGVIAPTSDVGAGALEGEYGGASAEVAAAYGGGANVLVGGFNDSITLQPLSVQGVEGVSLALGIAGMELKAK